MRKLQVIAPLGVVPDYFRLFVNRRAYTIQSSRPRPECGRHYYYRPTNKKTGEGLSLTADTIRRHLEGEITIGFYAINPATQCSKWVAIDADNPDALRDLARIRSQLKHDCVESALENSCRGGHLWFFLAEPLPARDCRIYVYDVALKLGIPIYMMTYRDVSSSMPLRLMIYYALEGKFFGEFAGSVGPRTDFLILRSGKPPFKIKEKVLEKKLLKLCQKIQPRNLTQNHVELLNGLVGSYFNEIPKLKTRRFGARQE